MNRERTRAGPNQKVAQRILIWLIVFGGLLGGVIGVIGVTDLLDIRAPQPWRSLVGFPLAVAVAWVSMVYWRNLDEAAREAHKFAWWWGGCGGLLLVLPILSLLPLTALEDLFGAHSPHGWVAGGVLGVLLLQTTGYLVAWAGWWLVRRR